MADELIEKLKLQFARDSYMTTLGVNQLFDGSPITSGDDRKRLSGYLFYMLGRLQACGPPPPPPKYSSHF